MTPEYPGLLEIDALVASVLPEPDDRPIGAAVRDHLVEQVYTVVHTRRPATEGSFSANRAEFVEMAREISQQLSGLTYRQPSMRLVQAQEDSVVVRCPAGVEFRVSPTDIEPEYLGYVTLQVSGLACPAEGRWLHWRGPDVSGANLDARIYLNLGVESAVPSWAAIVRALAAEAVEFTTKLGGSRTMLRRADSAVIYVNLAQLPRVLRLLTTLVSESDVEEPVAGFSYRVSRGIGVARAPVGSNGAASASRPASTLVSVGLHWANVLVSQWSASGSLEEMYAELARSWESIELHLRTAGAGV
ncbi:T3SS effector HopA1 family protein [Phytoactinopolyspora limicola]|uniref:T3SS effector HopA1 family protein n=1 Tax=Phytoactinopolyspora limicola TaxID=2715536 RepID=UPI001407702F|nr:T3SS effector HopA1 family protein [Phytoactinopolyspora limicola]